MRRCVLSIARLDEDERRNLVRTLKRLFAGCDALSGFSVSYGMVMRRSPTGGSDYEGVADLHSPNRTAAEPREAVEHAWK